MICVSPPFRLALMAALLGLALLGLAMAALPMPASAQACLSAGQMRSAIASGQIVRLAVVRSAVRAQGFSEIGSASVCSSGGRLVYTVVASNASGASARITLDASSGAILSVR